MTLSAVTQVSQGGSHPLSYAGFYKLNLMFEKIGFQLNNTIFCDVWLVWLRYCFNLTGTLFTNTDDGICLQKYIMLWHMMYEMEYVLWNISYDETNLWVLNSFNDYFFFNFLVNVWNHESKMHLKICQCTHHCIGHHYIVPCECNFKNLLKLLNCYELQHLQKVMLQWIWTRR